MTNNDKISDIETILSLGMIAIMAGIVVTGFLTHMSNKNRNKPRSAKRPDQAPLPHTSRLQLKQMELEQALEEEEYIEAARLLDEINELQQHEITSK